MKPIRWIFFSIMTACFFAGLYTGLRVYYIVFFTQILVIISVIAVNLWTVYAFTYVQELPCKKSVKGEQTSLRLEIMNERPVPLSLIEVHVNVVSLNENVDLLFSLAPYSGKKFEIPISLPYRGRYEIGMTKLKITDVFGLFTIPFDMQRLSYYRMAELIVLPKAEAPGTVSADIADAKMFGDAYLKQAEQGESVSGARLYRPGDTAKRIHWKKSVQQRNLFVKQYEHPERERVMIVIDISSHGLVGEAALIYADTICECAASIALHAILHGRAVYIISGDNNLPVKCEGLFGFEEIRHYLAVLLFKDQVLLEKAIDHAADSALSVNAMFVLTRDAKPSVTDRLSRTFAARHPVTMILVGGTRRSGRLHTIFVEAGSNAAESLSEIG